MITATSATMVSVIREPQMIREQMSRPSSSVPSQWVVEGGCRRWARSCAVGDCGASQGAKAATTTTRSRTMASPISAMGLARNRSQEE